MLQRDNVEKTLSVGLESGESRRRVLMINEERVTLSRYLNAMSVFAYSSARLEILRGSPEERRRFLDRGIASIDPSYLDALARTTRVLKQRNALLQEGAVASLVQRICREQHVAVLLVAHDVNPIVGYLDRVVYFAGGTAVAGAPGDVITSETLSRLYAAPIEVLQTRDGRLVVVGEPEAPFVHGDRHAHA